MLKKPQKKSFSIFEAGKTTVKILVAAELLGLAVSYGVWHRLNTNQDFRFYMNSNYPVLLEGFYKAANLLGKDTASVRAADLKAFEQKQLPKSQ